MPNSADVALFYCYYRAMITVGIDEVGRGCWAGPVVAGAAILAKPIPGLRDSKKLSKQQRERLAVAVNAQAVSTGLGWVDAKTVDEIGLTAAVRLAMELALAEIDVEFAEIIVDGHFNFLAEHPKSRAVIKADGSEPAVSAASIIAKVARDSYMTEISRQQPEYDFHKHVGYGTALHSQKLKLHGVSKYHRRTYKPVAALLAP